MNKFCQSFNTFPCFFSDSLFADVWNQEISLFHQTFHNFLFSFKCAFHNHLFHSGVNKHFILDKTNLFFLDKQKHIPLNVLSYEV